MRSYIISRARRRLGVVAVQAMARHRLARAPFIGVPRAVVDARLQRRGQVGPAPPLGDGWDHYGGFYEWVARGGAGGRAVAAGA